MKKKKQKNKAPVIYPIRHWSPSSMSQFLRNRLIFKKKYILLVHDDSIGVAGTIGKAAHFALKTYFGANDEVLVSNEETLARSESIQAGLDWLEKRGDHLIDYGKTGNREDLVKKYIRAITWYLEEMPKYELVFAEQKLEGILKGPDETDFAIPMKGYPDLVVRNELGEIEIVDHKFVTTYTDPDDEDPAKIIQAMFYFFLVQLKLGEAPKRFIFRECKTSENKDGTKQTKEWGIEYDKVPHYFSFFFRLYADCTKELCRPDALFLPNFSDMFDGENSYQIYQQELLGVDMSDVEIDHNTHHVRYMPKEMNFENSAVDSVDAANYMPEERVRIKLQEFGVPVKPDAIHHGPSVTLYTFKPSRGVSVGRIEKHAKDIAIALRVESVRVIPSIPGTNNIGIEVPREDRETVPYTSSLVIPNSFEVPIGVDIYGDVVRKDIRRMPHVIIAGATGAGKSVGINVFIKTLTAQLSPNMLRLVLIDPKRVELEQWANVPHSEGPVIHRVSDAVNKLKELCEMMDARYDTLLAAGAKSIEEYSGNMPYFVVVIDEFADLILSKEKVYSEDFITGKEVVHVVAGSEIETYVVRIAQKARAVGIHLVIGTQRPSINVLTGLIKANCPTRIAFMCSAQVDSRVVLDQNGAEELLGKGDMLFLDPAKKGLTRLQGFLV